MKAATWLRLLAAIMVFFTVGHTMGVLNPPADGAAGQALDAMRRAVPDHGLRAKLLGLLSGGLASS